MKVITEDDAIRILKDPNVSLSIVKEFRAACKEIDTFTVSKLRPMSEAPRDPNTRISVVRKGHDYFEAARFDVRNGGWQINFSAAMSDEFFEGWVPMLLYKPEQS